MIPYGRHFIDQSDIEAVISALKSDWLTCGSAVDSFEQHLAEEVGAQHAISCSNGTTALHLALIALDIGDQDTVLVPGITFLASANAARYVGADVAFVDVDPKTGLMTPETLEEAILKYKHKNLKAVINVHLAGQCEKLDSIHKIAKKYDLFIIEDAAHAVGTSYVLDGEIHAPIGANMFSDITTFSFHPVKTIALGEGGAVTTNDAKLAKKIRVARSHGMIRSPEEWRNTEHTGPWYYEMQTLGYNYRVSDINCALGLSQLKKLRKFKKERQQLVDSYTKALDRNKSISPIKHHKWSSTAWHLYPVLIDFEKMKINRAELINKLKEENIGTQVHYIPLTRQPYYQSLYGKIFLPGAEAYYEKCLSLPLYVGLTENDLNRVIQALNIYAR